MLGFLSKINEPSSISDWMMSFGKDIITAIILLLIAPFLLKWIRNKSLGSQFQSPKSSVRAHKFINCVISLACWMILMLVVFSVLGINLPPLIYIIVLAGIFIVITYSSSIMDFAGGLKILILKPYKVGDHVESEEMSGYVRKISLQKTTIVTDDNNCITIHNSKALTGLIKKSDTN